MPKESIPSSSVSDSFELAELLCARICHDLAGSVGAIATGAELLGEDLDIENHSIELLLTSSKIASIKLQFLRHAFAGGEKKLPPEKVKEILETILMNDMVSYKIEIDWSNSIHDILNLCHSRLLFNLAMIIQDCLPKGGRMRFERTIDDPTILTISIEGQSLIFSESAKKIEQNFMINIKSERATQGSFTKYLAHQIGKSISISNHSQKIIFTISPLGKNFTIDQVE
jgi:histidine phosphotransferase ChpT